MSETETATAVLDPAPVAAEPDTHPDPDLDPDNAAEVVFQGAAASDLPAIEARWMAPEELVIDDNVRKSFRVEDYPDEIASITERGVKDPINATRDDDGSIVAIDGQVRVLIARAVGTRVVPVFIVDEPAGLSATERRIERTIDQITFNERRIPLTKADLAGGVAMMLDLGASVTRVAKGLSTTRDRVRGYAKIGASPTAAALLDSKTNQFSFDQLAILGHYEALADTEAVARLESCSSYRFPHVASSIEAQRAEQRAQLQASLSYAAYGFGILTAEPDTSSEQAKYLPADLLLTADDQPLTFDQISADPARWVLYLHRQESAYLVDKDTGVIVDDDAVDWDTHDDADAVAAEGLLHADQVEHRDRWMPFCYLPADQLPDSDYHLAPLTVEESTDKENAAAEASAAVAKAAADREAARLKRARVRKLNVIGEGSKKRRADMLVTFFTAPQPPTLAAKFVAASIADKLDPVDLQKTLHILGVGGTRDALLKAIEAASPGRAWMIATAMIAAQHETKLGKRCGATTPQPPDGTCTSSTRPHPPTSATPSMTSNAPPQAISTTTTSTSPPNPPTAVPGPRWWSNTTASATDAAVCVRRPPPNPTAAGNHPSTGVGVLRRKGLLLWRIRIIGW
ncbi:ParB/RepB/Spo0J family partition protein [Nocardia brasiliensis]|uniref:ParB/RepB/Spo0J family partition protein n=1 Tax=Nocardia brasiliensis TaxID=37326 RepID=UPI00379FB7A6